MQEIERALERLEDLKSRMAPKVFDETDGESPLLVSLALLQMSLMIQESWCRTVLDYDSDRITRAQCDWLDQVKRDLVERRTVPDKVN